MVGFACTSQVHWSNEGETGGLGEWGVRVVFVNDLDQIYAPCRTSASVLSQIRLALTSRFLHH